MLTNLFQIGLAGAVGSLARYGITLGVLRLTGPGFPWGTLAVNVIGSFVMGMFVVVLAAHLRPMLMTGLVGGFTTFSAFSLDAVQLWERGEAGQAVMYVAGSVALSLLAMLAGLALARALA